MDIVITGGMNTISTKRSIAIIKIDATTFLSHTFCEVKEVQVRHSASLPAQTRKMV